VIFVVRREVNVLTKTERRKKRQKLRGESVCRLIEMNVEVTGDDKFVGSGSVEQFSSCAVNKLLYFQTETDVLLLGNKEAENYH